MIINAHCHLYNHPDIASILADTNNIFISTALKEEELEHHLLVSRKLSSPHTDGDNFLFSAGQHPMYPRESITIERVISLCEDNLLFAIGEIGLDRRNPDMVWQKDIFIQFADIANQFHKPVVLHCVGKYYEVYSLLKRQFPSLLIILHGFCGSVEIIQSFSKLNTVFSLHKSILKVKNCATILRAVCDTQRFLFETDMDTEISVMGTICNVSELLRVDVRVLVEVQEKTFRSLL